MPCPDELTLDLWLAEVLPVEEATTIAAHVAGCASCSCALLPQQTNVLVLPLPALAQL